MLLWLLDRRALTHPRSEGVIDDVTIGFEQNEQTSQVELARVPRVVCRGCIQVRSSARSVLGDFYLFKFAGDEAYLYVCICSVSLKALHHACHTQLHQRLNIFESPNLSRAEIVTSRGLGRPTFNLPRAGF